MHHAANLWNRGDDLLSTFWVITTGPSCLMKGREESAGRGSRRESKGNKKEETECMKLDSKLYKPPERGKGRDRKIERKGGLTESD